MVVSYHLLLTYQLLGLVDMRCMGVCECVVWSVHLYIENVITTAVNHHLKLVCTLPTNKI